jgi:outer membrane protein assembly factor BamB
MKRAMAVGAALFLILTGFEQAWAGTLYPMEGGTLRRENHALSLTSVALPLNLLWTATGCHGEPASNPVVLSDRVVQANRDSVICRSRLDGSVLWTWLSEQQVGLLWNPPCYDSTRDLLYQGSVNGAVVALRPSDGHVQWSHYEGQRPKIWNLASVTYFSNKIYFGDGNKSFVCIDAGTQAVLWRYNFGQWQGAVTPAIDGGFVYIAGTRGEIASLDAGTGALQWTVSAGVFHHYASAILLTNAYLYLMTSHGLVECRQRSNGSIVWTYQTDSYNLSNLSLGDQLYCGSDDHYVHKLDLLTGTLIWKHSMGGGFARSGPFYVGGTIFISGCGGDYDGLDSNGNTVWSYTHGADNTFSDWAEADGLLFVSNRQGQMHCFAPKGVNPFATPTPRYDDLPYGHDVDHLKHDEGAAYPNPVRGGHCRFAFDMDEAGTSRIRVFTASGAQASSFSHQHEGPGTKSVDEDLSGYAPGVYFFIVDRKYQSGKEDKTKLGKFLVVK